MKLTDEQIAQVEALLTCRPQCKAPTESHTVAIADLVLAKFPSPTAQSKPRSRSARTPRSSKPGSPKRTTKPRA